MFTLSGKTDKNKMCEQDQIQCIFHSYNVDEVKDLKDIL